MKVEVYIGLGTQKKRIWKGDLDVIPRKGEDVVIDKDGDRGYTVDYVHHWLADKHVELFVR